MEDIHDWLAIGRALTKNKNYGIKLELVLHPLLFCSMNPKHWISSFIICPHWLRDPIHLLNSESTPELSSICYVLLIFIFWDHGHRSKIFLFLFYI